MHTPTKKLWKIYGQITSKDPRPPVPFLVSAFRRISCVCGWLLLCMCLFYKGAVGSDQVWFESFNNNGIEPT